MVILPGPRHALAAAPAVFINELHYDNTGTDAGEAIEVAGPAGTDLAGWTLVLYNGSNGVPYDTANQNLTGVIPDQQNGFGTLSFARVGLQNGSPDGVALVDASSSVVQFLCYEGTFVAVGGAANGMTCVDIGVSELSSAAVGDSLQLTGTGTKYGDFTWAGSQPNTFGSVNTGQSFGGAFINELHYDNTGTDAGEAIEVAGPAGTNLAGWTLVLYNGSGGAPYDTANQNLTGVIPDQQNGFGTLSFARVGLQNGSPDGVALVDASSNVVQFLCYEGTFVAVGGAANGMTCVDIGVSEVGSAALGDSLQLTGTGTKYGDFTWAGSQPNTFGSVNTGQSFGNGPTSPSGIGLATPSSVDPGGSSLLTVTVTPGKNPASTGLTVSCDLTSIGGSGSQTFVDNGTNGDVASSDNVFSYNATIGSGTFGSKSFLCTISDAQSRSSETTIDITINEYCGDAFTNIYDIQGSGSASPLVGTEVAVEGIVVGDFQNNSSLDNGNLNGFNIQDLISDGNPATSDGIFVYASGAADVSIGDIVRVRGNISEYNGLTEVSASKVWKCSTGNALPDPVSLSLPVPSGDYFEAFEGMLVTFPQSLFIAEYFNFDRYGEIVLTSERHLTPSAEFDPGPAAIQAAADFLLDKITLDDGRSTQNPDPAIHPNGNVFDLTNLFRGGDTVQNVTGIMDYSFSLYRIQPTKGADYTVANPRPIQPEPVGGTLKVASFNVLNYFSTIDTGPSNWICGPAQNMECRGADTPEEFTRQRDKIIAALQILNADVVGVFEIENNVNDDALKDMVNGLNTKIGSVTYAYVDTGVIGTDAIKVAIIYKPSRVSLVGNYAILDSTVDPRFLDTKNRPSLAQSFRENSSGDVFTVDVNHLKSKGSDCNDVSDPDTGNGAGNCNITRTLAAQALVDWLDTDPTNSEDSDYLIIGDLNSYDKEDPIDAILAGPDDVPGTSDDYTDMVFAFQGEDAYSYVFDGKIGYIDHALASATLKDQITGVVDWHINADEPDLIDYDMTFKLPAQDALYASDPYRASDHDPVVIGLDLDYQMKPIAEACPAGLTITRNGYTVTIPAGAVSECVDVYLEKENTSAGPINPNGYLSLDHRVQILVQRSNGTFQSTFNLPLEVCVDYSDEDLAKAGSDPNYLKIWTAQKGATAWQMLATTPYPVQKQVCAKVSHLSYFDLFFEPASTPATGFAPGRLTILPMQTTDKTYTSLGNLWVEIPRIGVKVAITGVPLSAGQWDVSWLNNQVGWLEGTAFPSWDGNSVITGHVYDSNGLPGLFVNLSQLWYGDQIIIHAFGESHVYEVQTIFQVQPDAVKSILKHEDASWLTLVTCRGYDPVSDTYGSRFVIRAINVDDK